jgi:molybdenum cofactor cytidylyltransferase
MMPPLPALLLAAGASRRLGRPKQLERIDGEPLLRRAARAALEAGFHPVLVVLGSERERVLGALEGLDVAPVFNPLWEEGMASGLRLGVAALPPGAAGVLLLVCDQVALDPGILRRLRAAFDEHPERPAACAYGGTVGVPAILPSASFPALALLRGDTGARALLRTGAISQVPWPEGVQDLDGPHT